MTTTDERDEEFNKQARNVLRNEEIVPLLQIWQAVYNG